MAVNRERKMVEDEYTSRDFGDNTLDEAIRRLQTYRKELGGDARFAIREYEYSDNTYLALMKTRPETDAEMAKRIANEERWAAQREQQERDTFERLAKKYGKA